MMTRIEQLESVLRAARGVLTARADQMLTQVEWDKLAESVAAVEVAKPLSPLQPVRIVIEDGLMMVMDAGNNGYDCCNLCDCTEEFAVTTLGRWAHNYVSDIESA